MTARAALSLRRPEALRAALGKWEKMRKNLDAETSALIEPVKPPPHQDRLITVREAARLQGFPDHFRFSGHITSMYKQIGNAVPPPLGRAIAVEVAASERRTAERRAVEAAAVAEASAAGPKKK